MKINFLSRKTKGVISLALVVSIIATNTIVSSAHKAEEEKTAMLAAKYEIKGHKSVDGSMLVGTVPDMQSAIKYLLGGEDTVIEEELSVSEKNCDIKNDTYVENDVNIETDKLNLGNKLVAEGNINIKCDSIDNTEFSVIYAVKGDVTIECESLYYNGLIVAPNGTVELKSKKADIDGCVVGSTIKSSTKKMTIEAKDDSEKIYRFLRNYVNEGFMAFDSYVNDEGNLRVCCNANKELEKVKVFARYEDNDKFEFLGEIQSYEGEIEDISYKKNLDVIVEGVTKFGEVIDSSVISLGRDDDGEQICIDRDSDSDGIFDGLEIYYLETNPNCADSDADGITDGAEIFNFYTNPTEKNPDYEDFDGDGMTSIMEYLYGSNPYLVDTDFDGIDDKKDMAPRSHKKKSEANSIEYYALGRFDKIITEIDEYGNMKQRVYDIIHRRDKYVEEYGVKTAYYYDYDNRLASKVIEMAGKTNTMNYQYDDNDNIKSIFNNNYTYGFKYDDEARITEFTINSNKIVSYKYDENGRKTVYANQNVEKVDIVNDVIVVNNQDGKVCTVEADKTENSEVVNYIDNDIEIKYNYNELGDVEKIESNTGFTVNYIYPDEDGTVSVETTLPTTEIIKEKTEELEVKIIEEAENANEPVNTNELDVKQEIAETVSKEITGEYLTEVEKLEESNKEEKKEQQDKTTSITEEVKDAALVTAYEIGGEYYYQADFYDNDNNGYRIQNTKLISGDVMSTYAEDTNTSIVNYCIDGKEYKEKIMFADNSSVESIEFVDGSTEKYEYVKQNCLSSVIKNDNQSVSYNYDALGRLIEEKDFKNNRDIFYYYDMSNNIQKIESYKLKKGKKAGLVEKKNYKYSADYGDQLVNFNETEITYDKAGNPIKYLNGMTFEWNGKQLVSCSLDGKTIEYDYDVNGIIISKKVNGKRTDYNIDYKDFISETNEENERIYVYDSQGNNVGFIYNGTKFYYEKNVLNDVIRIVDDSFREVCTYEYDAMGNVILITGDKEIAKINPYRYRSYYYDEDLGLYYLRSRFYDSNTGRFLNMDSESEMFEEDDNYNLYAYCGNDFINKYDPLGTTAHYVIFSQTQRKYEPENIANGIKDYYKNYMGYKDDDLRKYVSIVTKYPKTSGEMKDLWNSIANCQVIIFNSHGSPIELSFKDENYKEYFNVLNSSLNLQYKEKNIKLIFMTGCNTGHSKYNGSCIAFKFSKLIMGGIVIACDCTVNSNNSGNKNGVASYTPVLEDIYIDANKKDAEEEKDAWIIWWGEDYTKDKYRNGWRIFRKDTLIRVNLGIGEMSIEYILTITQKYNYFKNNFNAIK